MKRKPVRAEDDLKIKVITDPRELAWLKAKIDSQKAGGQTGAARKKRIRPA